jgi:hypothetical protein
VGLKRYVKKVVRQVKASAKQVGQKAGAYAAPALPVVGGLIFGPAGALGGGAAGAALSRLGANESAVFKSRLLNVGISTGVSFAATGLTALVRGTGFAQSPFGTPAAVTNTVKGATQGQMYASALLPGPAGAIAGAAGAVQGAAIGSGAITATGLAGWLATTAAQAAAQGGVQALTSPKDSPSNTGSNMFTDFLNRAIQTAIPNQAPATAPQVITVPQYFPYFPWDIGGGYNPYGGGYDSRSEATAPAGGDMTKTAITLGAVLGGLWLLSKL